MWEMTFEDYLHDTNVLDELSLLSDDTSLLFTLPSAGEFYITYYIESSNTLINLLHCL